MATIVYWSCIEKEWLRAKEPQPIYSEFIKNQKDQATGIKLCPAIKDYTKNTFSLKSIYDYCFETNENINGAFSNLYDQNFFDEHVVVRSDLDKLFTFNQYFIFFTEEKSLQMSTGLFPYLEDNNITKRCILVPGQMDIGKWFRTIEFVFYLKSKYKEFKISENEIYQYIKFNTEDKIIFKQFTTNEKIEKYLKDSTSSKNYRKKQNRPITNYYDMLKHKKHIIKEIKKNLI
jgi:hypothetical protein